MNMPKNDKMTTNTFEYKYLFKYIIVGDTGVGKSALTLRFTDDRFQPIHDLTIGVEFGTKIIDLNGTNIKLQIWDTAGQEAFKSITRSYYKNVGGAILVYDISRRDTFNNITKWISDLNNNCDNKPTTLLIGNKIDLTARRTVTTEEGKKLAETHGFKFIETSVKNNINVCKAFELISQTLYEKLINGDIEPDKINGVKISHSFELSKSRTLTMKDKCCIIC